MQIRNNYDKEVYNGDIGRILKINTEDQEVTVLFDGKRVDYDYCPLRGLGEKPSPLGEDFSGPTGPEVGFPRSYSKAQPGLQRCLGQGVFPGRLRKPNSSG